MTEGEALRSCCIQNMEDDLAKRVYADWLRETNQDDIAELVLSLVGCKWLLLSNKYPWSEEFPLDAYIGELVSVDNKIWTSFLVSVQDSDHYQKGKYVWTVGKRINICGVDVRNPYRSVCSHHTPSLEQSQKNAWLGLMLNLPVLTKPLEQNEVERFEKTYSQKYGGDKE